MAHTGVYTSTILHYCCSFPCWYFVLFGLEVLFISYIFLKLVISDETQMWTNHMDNAAACSLMSTASFSGSHQWWDHFFPKDHLEAWTCTSTDTQLRSSDISAMNGVMLGLQDNKVPLFFCEYPFRVTCVASVLLVIGECVHQQPLLYELLPLGILCLQVAVVVIGHYDAVWVEGQLDDVPVVVAHHPLAVYAARWCVYQDLPPLQLMENMLIYGTHENSIV